MSGTEDDSRFAGFRLEREIGRGGMGVVYLAEHVHLGRRVALKFLAPGLIDTDGFRERFVRESRVAASLNHPNIVTVYDAGESDGQLYIAMQYVDGTDLSTLLEREGALEPERAVDILTQLASALDAAHAEGLVHRDVKPANVLMRDGHAYLTDFGLTKRTASATSLTGTGQFVGTAQYMAPEQILGEAVDGRADLYALGCILYHCLTGAAPYERDNSVAVIYAHLSDPPPSAVSARPGLPAGFDPVIARAMAKPRDDRHPTCMELAEAARAALSGTVEAPAPPPPAQAPAPVPARRRGRGPLIAAAVAAIAVVAVLVVVLAGGGEQPASEPPSATTTTAAADATPTPEPPDLPVPEPGGEIPVGTSPSGLAADFDNYSVWVANEGDDTVSRVDTGAANVTENPVPVGSAPAAIAFADGYVWVANRDSDTLSRIKAGRKVAAAESFPAGAGPTGVAVAGDTVWVVNGGDDTVSRHDSDGAALGDAAKVGRGPHAIAADAAGAWVTNGEEGTVTRLDADGRPQDPPVRVGGDPAAILILRGVVWVANRGDDTVTRIDAASGETLGEPVPVGRAPSGLGLGGGVIWVANTADGTVLRLDPRSGARIGEPIPAGTEPIAVAADDYSAFVADATGSVVQLSLQP
jgi:YVTN family beta-propeller protein